MVRVENLESESSGRAIANQFEIFDRGKAVNFQSYQSIIVKISKGKTYLDKNKWNYSNTTSRYRNQFLRETTKETKAKIKSGEYKLVDLNK